MTAVNLRWLEFPDEPSAQERWVFESLEVDRWIVKQRGAVAVHAVIARRAPPTTSAPDHCAHSTTSASPSSETKQRINALAVFGMPVESCRPS